MKKVHPNYPPTEASGKNSGEAIALTVWRKSLVFNCNGFTVFNGTGQLKYRVDCYQSGSTQILLMDAAGNSLFTIRRKRMGFGDTWMIYEGESSVNPLLSAKKYRILSHNSKAMLLRVSSARQESMPITGYEVEGSYGDRRCSVYECWGVDCKTMIKKKVAEIKQKEAMAGMAFGCDVFRLVVWPDMVDPSLAMAVLVLVDQMLGNF